jgi:hypothetical protein
LENVFNEYTDEEFGFSKTIIPVRLADLEGNSLISRSQAKRIANRFENFKLVILDFEGVNEIGQGFADELFRVTLNNLKFKDFEIKVINANDNIERMIKHVTS